LKITRFICDGCNKHDAGDLDWFLCKSC
jgi:hypothetical protein